MYRVLVTGSREFTNRTLVHQTLSAIAANYRPLVVIHGGAMGADKFAQMWAETKDYVKIEEVPAEWGRQCDEKCTHQPTLKHVDGKEVSWCPQAGFIRNQEMVDRGADVCLAFFKSHSDADGITVDAYDGKKLNRGTIDCATRAEAAGINTYRYWGN